MYIYATLVFYVKKKKKIIPRTDATTALPFPSITLLYCSSSFGFQSFASNAAARSRYSCQNSADSFSFSYPPRCSYEFAVHSVLGLYLPCNVGLSLRNVWSYRKSIPFYLFMTSQYCFFSLDHSIIIRSHTTGSLEHRHIQNAPICLLCAVYISHPHTFHVLIRCWYPKRCLWSVIGFHFKSYYCNTLYAHLVSISSSVNFIAKIAKSQ